MATGPVFDTLNQVLAQLRRLPDVLAVVIARRDGVVISSNLSRRADPRKVAAMAASIVGTSEAAVGELGQGDFKKVMVESEMGRVLGLGAGDEAILIALVRRDANVGLVLLNMEKCAAQIGKVLQTQAGEEVLLTVSGG